jgi:hypothetical protein
MTTVQINYDGTSEVHELPNVNDLEIDTHPFEFNENNRARIIELFDLYLAVQLNDITLIDYVYTSIQQCDPVRFEKETYFVKDALIETKVTIEILEYFKAKDGYLKPICESTTFAENINNIKVCRWILENCGIDRESVNRTIYLLQLDYHLIDEVGLTVTEL